ncbi:MAG TPA: TonB-dependent receptor, partial [Acidobacteriota bacterium]|nr:TonB-dependent receptor [Acidobacteriota bacterium]
GAGVAGARVYVVNEETALSRHLTTTAEGLFRANLLPPGRYSVIIDAPGFKDKTLHSIRVAVTETAVVNVTLDVGAPATEVKVTDSPYLAQTETSALGQPTDGKTIVALPLANRNFSQILALSPGVVVEIPNAGNLGKNTQNVSVNGAKTTANNFQFDGVDANNMSQNSASGFDPEVGIAIPAPDTIAEFKVQTGMYDAGYGRGAGANVDIVSKSGTNALHGNLWEFLRNDDLNANDFFVKQSGQPRPVLKQHQFGGAIGGPIQKDKTFFFGSYQASIQRNGFAPNVSLQSSFLPLLPNDRSVRANLGAAFCPQNHAPGDPFYQSAAGGVQVACDGSNINPVAFALLNFKFANGKYAIPSPQTTVDSNIGQSTFSSPARYREDQFSTNLDHNFSRNNQLAGRFFYSRATTNEPFTPFGANLPGWGTDEIERNDMFVLSDTHVFRPNLINVARFGFMRFDGFLSGEEPISAADLGMATPSGLPEIPGIAVNGLFTIGPAGQPFYFQNTNTFIWQDTVSWIRGRHSLRLGAEVKRHQVDVNVPFVTDGFLFFQSLPDFLLGMNSTDNQSPSGLSNVDESVGASGDFRKDQRYTDFAGFLQDDFKVTQRLTVNAGVRYEIFGPPSEIRGHLSNFDPTHAALQVPQAGSYSGFLLPSNYRGSLPPGFVKTGNSGVWNPDYRDFAPRLGFAWHLSDRPTVVLRGGYGIYYTRLSGQLAEQNIGQPPFSITQSLLGSANAAATFQQPYNPQLPPDSAYPIFNPRTPDSAFFLAGIARSMPSPYMQQYDLNVQYEVARDLLWQVGYVGSKTTHLTGCVEFNQALIATPEHPVNGLTKTTVDNLPQRLPYTGIASGSYTCGTTFNANYNSLQTYLNKRFSHGLDLLASYTWSKNRDFTSGTGGLSQLDLDFLSNDQTNPRQARGLNDFDRKHRFVLSFVYDSPRFEAGPNIVRHLLSSWRFSGQTVLQSGVPVTATDSSAGSAYGNLIGFERAQCTGLNPASSGSL